ncbi:MAG: Smr/MutS family protein [Sphingomonas sp.]|uniref:Smr/MutS family protein n=1 Tax=Sphingomonas sp. TaxID=28214 RepID=UPI001B218A6B|nr:Smr/MutS family protein [Sphingomonas sp.]MBO9622391.1 Smr/MutS family protein [Sphingomonas sp.]
MSGRGTGSRVRALAPEEAALWKRVIATVKPLASARAPARPPAPEEPAAPTPAARPEPVRPAPKPRRAAAPAPIVPPRKEPPQTLDASWDRKLGRGMVAPESSIDLHGHSLASAYDLLDRGLDAAIRRGDRVLLLITGKPPRPESERPHARGAIRAAVGDWLAASRHADRIAAVRGAHPRHGGTGALYIVLRRERGHPSRNS